MKKQYQVEKDCLRTITFNLNNSLERSIAKYLKILKEEKDLNPKDCVVAALLLYCEPEIIEAAGGSDREIAISKRRSLLQLEARSKLLMFELGLDGENDRQDRRKISVSAVDEEKKEENEEKEEEDEAKKKDMMYWGNADG